MKGKEKIRYHMYYEKPLFRTHSQRAQLSLTHTGRERERERERLKFVNYLSLCVY